MLFRSSVVDTPYTGNNNTNAVVRDFGPTSVHEVSLALINGNPAITFSYLEGGVHRLAYVRSNSATGATWATDIEQVTTRTSGTANEIDIVGRIKLIPAPEDEIVVGTNANAGNPLIAYRTMPPAVTTAGVDDDYYISVSRGTDADGTAWLALDANSRFGSVTGRALDMTDTVHYQSATPLDRKSTRLNSSHSQQSRMPSSA